MSIHGKNTHVSLDNAAGTLTDIQQYSRSMEDSESLDTGETTNFGQNAKTYVVGQSDATLSLDGTFHQTFLTMLYAARDALLDGTQTSLTLRIGYAGNGTGAAFTEREVIITAINVSASKDDVVALSVEFQRTGETTTGTY